jgi:hypothetical protein
MLQDFFIAGRERKKPKFIRINFTPFLLNFGFNATLAYEN